MTLLNGPPAARWETRQHEAVHGIAGQEQAPANGRQNSSFASDPRSADQNARHKEKHLMVSM